jgi:CBS-domain-containing membrane protein
MKISPPTRANRIRENKSILVKKLQYLLQYLWLKLNRSRKYQPKFSSQNIFFSYLGGFVGIALLAYLSDYTNYPLIAAPFGATAVLVFGVPESPLAQPRNVIGGNCIGAIVSIVLVLFFGTAPWVEALAVANTIKLMQITKTLHPPGGAVALVGVMGGASWQFFFTPVLAGSIITVFFTYYFNNLISKRPYPKHWF